MKAVDVAEKADPSGFILAREERTRLLERTQRLSDLLRAEDLDVAWYIDAMREPEHIEYAKVFLQTVRKTLSGEIQRFPEDSDLHRTSIKVSNNFLQKRGDVIGLQLLGHAGAEAPSIMELDAGTRRVVEAAVDRANSADPSEDTRGSQESHLASRAHPDAARAAGGLAARVR